MKRLFLLAATACYLSSCGNNKGNENGAATEATTQTETAKPADPEAEKGLQLIAQSDCLTCHKVAEASTGPAYEAIAAKYDNTPAVIDTLASKIIKGGYGNWGTVPMTPHPQLSQDDARTMVKYVLSLKK